MFRTLNQSLDESTVDMAIIDSPQGRELIKRNTDGSGRVILTRNDELKGYKISNVKIDEVNRRTVLRGINTRPVVE